MGRLSVFAFFLVLLFNCGCISTGRLVAKKEIPKKTLVKYRKACIHVTSVKKFSGEIPYFLSATIDRLRREHAFDSVEACGDDTDPAALKIILRIKKIDDGNAFLAGMGWGGNTEMIYDVAFQAGAKTAGDFLATANSRQVFMWEGNRWGSLRQKTMANAAAEIAIFIIKNKDGKDY